jgi:hypothetical protein
MTTATKDDLNTPLIVVIGVLFAILTFVLIVLLQAWFYQQQVKENLAKVVAPDPQELTAVMAQQQAELHSYRLIDGEQGIVAIPIERAMELIVQEASTSASPR